MRCILTLLKQPWNWFELQNQNWCSKKLLGPVQGRQQLARAGLWRCHRSCFWCQHCLSSLTTWPHSSFSFPSSLCQFILFISRLPFILHFLLLPLLLALYLPIHSSLFSCLISSCPITPEAITWRWQHRRPLVPPSKPCSSVPVNFTTNQGTFAYFRLGNHVILNLFCVHI